MGVDMLLLRRTGRSTGTSTPFEPSRHERRAGVARRECGPPRGVGRGRIGATRRGSQGGRVLLWFVRTTARAGGAVLCRVRDRGAGGRDARGSGGGTVAAPAPIRSSVPAGAGRVRSAVPDAVRTAAPGDERLRHRVARPVAGVVVRDR